MVVAAAPADAPKLNPAAEDSVLPNENMPEVEVVVATAAVVAAGWAAAAPNWKVPPLGFAAAAPNEKVGGAAGVAFVSVEVVPKVNEAPAGFGTELFPNWKVGAAEASGAAVVAATGAMLFVAPPNWKVAAAVPAAGSAALAAPN